MSERRRVLRACRSCKGAVTLSGAVSEEVQAWRKDEAKMLEAASAERKARDFTNCVYLEENKAAAVKEEEAWSLRLVRYLFILRRRGHA